MPSLYKVVISILIMLGICYKTKAQVLVYDTLNIKVIPVLATNTKYSEYSPFIFNKQFYFISDRESDLFVKGYEQSTQLSFSHLFKSLMIDSLKIKSIQEAKEEAVSKIFVGPFCETTSGYYYTTNNTSTKKGNKPLKLQISFIEKVAGGKNNEPVKISFGLYDTISCAHPSVLNDTLMVFASDWQENSQGKIDLFYSIKKNNEWQTPVNFGKQINSPFNESFPVLVNEELFFSSDRTNGFGMLDIYKINRLQKDSIASLLPYPINSPFDDFGVCPDSLPGKGYLSSNRNGNDDIFYFRNVKPEISNCEEMKNNNFCYTFYEEAAIETQDTVGQTYEWTIGNVKIRGAEVKHCFEREGKYQIKLNVIDKSSGETFYNVLTTEFDLQMERQLFIYSPDSTATGKEILFDPSYSNIEGLMVNRYFWDFGDGQISFNEKPKHTYTKDGTYVVKFAVEGFIAGKKVKKCVTKKIVTTSSISKDVFLYNLPKMREE